MSRDTALKARSRRTSRVLILPMPLGAFQPPKPDFADPPSRNEMESVPQGLKAGCFCWVYIRAEARTYQPVPSVNPGHAFSCGARFGWCERGDSNPHGLPRQILSLVRLPISPLSHFAAHYIDDNRPPLPYTSTAWDSSGTRANTYGPSGTSATRAPGGRPSRTAATAAFGLRKARAARFPSLSFAMPGM